MVALTVVAMSACGSDNVTSTSTTATDTTATTDGATSPTTTAVATTGGGDDGSGEPTGEIGDYIELAEALAPSNDEEFSRLEGESAIHISWRSTDPPETLRDHYEKLIADLGLSVISTLDPPCCIWGFTTDSPATGGSIQVMADGEGSTVAVTASPTG
ncbi:MAG TPA: hypothetical protein VFS66_13675 [Acidimicrobiia bacterium]|nr:hypothetical protein [Acidimicrobiia bacterium]